MTVPPDPGVSDTSSGAVEFLLRRIQRSSDFPALSETIRTLNQVSASGDKPLEQLAAIIVRDLALTSKILKVVNSVYYSGFAGKVGTVSRAIVVLGIEPIRSLAASLLLFDHLSAGSQTDRLKTLIGTSMFGALLAREAAGAAGLRQGEEAFLGALFHDLGELLVIYYLPDEDDAIRKLIASAAANPVQAQLQVLGVSFEQLGAAIGKHWNFPHAITYSMKKLGGGKPARPTSDDEILRQLACFASEATQLLAAGKAPGDAALDGLLKRYSDCIKLDDQHLAELLQNTRSEYRMLAEGLARPEQASVALRALAQVPARTRDEVEAGADLGEMRAMALPGEDDSAAGGRGTTVDAAAVLLEGLQEVTTMLAEQAALNQVAQVVLETLYRGLGLRRVALCLRDLKHRQYVGRLGFGADVADYLQALRFTEGYERDVFHVALEKQTDMHIADLSVGRAGHGIPSWYHALSPAGALLFLPLTLQGRPVGCVLAEHDQINGMALDPATLRLVRALRNQLVLGFQLRRGKGN